MKRRTNRQLTKDNRALRREVRGNSERAELLHISFTSLKHRVSMLRSAIERAKAHLTQKGHAGRILEAALVEDRQYD